MDQITHTVASSLMINCNLNITEMVRPHQRGQLTKFYNSHTSLYHQLNIEGDLRNPSWILTLFRF